MPLRSGERHRASSVRRIQGSLGDRPEGPIRVTMVSRVLWDKGVREFVEAAALVCKVRGDIAFTLARAPDRGNPASVSSEQVRS